MVEKRVLHGTSSMAFRTAAATLRQTHSSDRLEPVIHVHQQDAEHDSRLGETTHLKVVWNRALERTFPIACTSTH